MGPKSKGSGLDAQRELLDSLMGINRNNESKNNKLDYRDDKVCKFFLAGSCPHDMFVNTKMDEGPCPKIHSEAIKTAFQNSTDLYIFDNYIEREFLGRIAEAERVIRKARQRVEEGGEKTDEDLNPEINPEVLRVHAEMSKVINLAENFAAIDDIDNCFELMTKVEDLQKEKQGLVAKITDLKKQRIGMGTDKKLRVCDICGSFLSIFDSDKRLTDHFMGKQHVGFQYMRDVVAEIQKRRDEKRSKPSSDNNASSSNTANRRDDSYSRGRDGDNYRRDNNNSNDYRGGGGNRGYRDNNDRDYHRRGDSRERRDNSRNRNNQQQQRRRSRSR